jgi:hypothetical protein
MQKYKNEKKQLSKALISFVMRVFVYKKELF